MQVQINGTYTNIHIEREDLIKELIKETKEGCWCSFDRCRPLYKELAALIRSRSKESVDPGCIE
jgi:hypothetical protein